MDELSDKAYNTMSEEEKIRYFLGKREYFTEISETPGNIFLSEITRNEVEANKIKLSYGIEEDKIVNRILSLRAMLEKSQQRKIGIDELIKFLKNAMNYDEMQIWLLSKQMDSIELTLNDKLGKFFELKSDEDILRIYDSEQNYDQNNINNISSVIDGSNPNKEKKKCIFRL